MRKIEFLKTNLIAHRGLFDEKIIENSIPAFINAIKNNYTIELDVHLLKDNNIVVFHDDTLKRLYNKNIILKDIIYGDIKKYNIPLFKDVLKLVNGKIPLIIEIKCDNKVGKLESELVKYLDNYNGAFAVKSFNPKIIKWFKKNRPSYIRGVLFTDKGEYPLYLIYLYTKYLVKPDFISVRYTALKKRYIKQYRKKIFTLAWLIKSESQYLNIKDYADNYIFERFNLKAFLSK